MYKACSDNIAAFGFQVHDLLGNYGFSGNVEFAGASQVRPSIIIVEVGYGTGRPD